MRELSLFTGAGGGLLGTKLMGWTHVGYVEINEYCQRVIAQRIEDGILDRAPIFTDVREFLQSGAAEQYRGIADVVTGGFPCQDISTGNAKGKGIAGERSGLWSVMAEIIRVVRPQYVLVENSPALTIRGLGVVLRDLAGMGFDARWGVLGADDTGAPHKRKRIWVVGNASSIRQQENYIDVRQHTEEREKYKGTWNGRRMDKPGIIGVADGVPGQMDRLKALGNGQVPIVAATAWQLLSGQA